jgi:hypothetical protein
MATIPDASRLAQDASREAQTQQSTRGLILPALLLAAGGIGTIAWVLFLLDLLMDVLD